MQPVVGEECASPIQGGDCLAFLDWHDGPMLTLYRVGGALVLVVWSDHDDVTSRWLAVRVSRERFDAFGDGAVTLAAMFSQPEDGNVVVIDGDVLSIIRCVRVTSAELPQDLLPGDEPLPRERWHERPKLDGDKT